MSSGREGLIANPESSKTTEGEALSKEDFHLRQKNTQHVNTFFEEKCFRKTVYSWVYL